MERRLQLQKLLEAITPNVYFQPPSNLAMEYPCIVYERGILETRHADNSPYRLMTRYKLTVIDPSPDSDIPGKIASLPLCRHNRFFVAENLNHDVFNLYY